MNGPSKISKQKTPPETPVKTLDEPQATDSVPGVLLGFLIILFLGLFLAAAARGDDPKNNDVRKPPPESTELHFSLKPK